MRLKDAVAMHLRWQTHRWSALSLFSPHRLLRPSEIGELGGPERRLADREEFVELRRGDGRARQHRVRLSAMVDVMLEQMHQKAIAAFVLDVALAMDVHDAVQPFGRERVAERDQAAVDRGLRALQTGDIRIWNGGAPGPRSERSALQRIDVKQI